jgi:hypothetical protein
MRAGKELEKIKGYPILTELTWNLAGDACSNQEQAAGSSSSSSSSSTPSSVGGAVSSVASWFAKRKTDEKAKEIADSAILSFVVEVKSHGVQPINDSVFSPPKGYRMAAAK